MWTWSGVVLPIFTMASVIAAVISRFCWSVRPAYHWIVMFGMARLLSVGRVGCGGGIAARRPSGQGAAPPPPGLGTPRRFPGLTPRKKRKTREATGPEAPG